MPSFGETGMIIATAELVEDCFELFETGFSVFTLINIVAIGYPKIDGLGQIRQNHGYGSKIAFGIYRVLLVREVFENRAARRADV